MGRTTDELEALRMQRAAAPPSAAAEIGQRSIQELISSRIGASYVRVGDQAADFALPDHNGRVVTLAGLLSQGPTVLSFYRGAWCPFCNIELRGLQLNYPRMRELGATLVAISPQLPDGSLTVAERHSLEFPVLSDLGNTVAKTYGLVFRVNDDLQQVFRERGLDLSQVNGEEGANELPIPGTFVVRRQGVVAAAFVNADHTHRTDPEEIVSVLETL